MDPVTLYAADGRSVIVRSPVEKTNLLMSGYRDQPPATVTVESPPGAADETFDPSEHTVDEVNAFLAEHPDLAAGVLAAEAAGKNRAGIVGSGDRS